MGNIIINLLIKVGNECNKKGYICLLVILYMKISIVVFLL